MYSPSSGVRRDDAAAGSHGGERGQDVSSLINESSSDQLRPFHLFAASILRGFQDFAHAPAATDSSQGSVTTMAQQPVNATNPESSNERHPAPLVVTRHDFQQLRALCGRASTTVTLALSDETESQQEQYLESVLEVLRKMESILGVYDGEGPKDEEATHDGESAANDTSDGGTQEAVGDGTADNETYGRKRRRNSSSPQVDGVEFENDEERRAEELRRFARNMQRLQDESAELDRRAGVEH